MMRRSSHLERHSEAVKIQTGFTGFIRIYNGLKNPEKSWKIV
jgi:hypothetical protein